MLDLLIIDFIKITDRVLRHYRNTETQYRKTVANIGPETFCKIARKVLKRANARLREGSEHFQHLL